MICMAEVWISTGNSLHIRSEDLAAKSRLLRINDGEHEMELADRLSEGRNALMGDLQILLQATAGKS